MNKFLTLISSLFLMACSNSANGPDGPNVKDPAAINLSLSTGDAVGRTMDLCYVVFDNSGVVVLQDRSAVTKIQGIDLQEGKASSVSIKNAPVDDDFSVLVVAYGDIEESKITINESISNVTESLIKGGSGMLGGDYFVGTTKITKGSSSAKLELRRASSKLAINLDGDRRLTSSVSRIEVQLTSNALFDAISGSGSMAQQTKNQPLISITAKESIYLLPSVSEQANTAVLKVHYDEGKVAEVNIGSELGFYFKSNYSTLLTLTLLKKDKPTDPSEPEHPSDQDANITISLSGKWITKNDLEFSNTPTQSTYYTYKTERKLTTSNFIPGAMSIDGDLAYVVNLQGRTQGGGKPTPSNPNYYPIEVFDLSSGKKVRTIEGWATTSGGATQRLTGTPRAIVAADNKLFVCFSEGTLTPPRTVVLDATTGQFITYIGRGAPWQVTKNDFDTDEVMALYATKDYLFMTDNGHMLRIYRQSEITNDNSAKIKPMAISAVEVKFGKPRIMSFFRDPQGMLFRTDYATKRLIALDETKITEGIDIDIEDPASSIDLTQSMYEDLNITSNIQTTFPYCVAYHHGNMFVGVNSPNDSDNEEGIIVEYTALGKRYGAHRSVVGHTFRKPVQIVVKGDRMIVSDQLSKQIVIVKIESHTVNHYE